MPKRTRSTLNGRVCLGLFVEVFNFQTEDRCGYCAISAEKHPGVAGPGSYFLNWGAGDLGPQVFSL